MTVVDSVFNVIAFGLAFSLVGLGVFLSNRVFRLIDLTCEYSFALGGCAYGSMVLAGINPLVAITISILLGYISGTITASFVNYIKLDPIVAGLLTIGGLQSLLIKLVEIKRNNPISVFGNLSPINNLILALIIAGIAAYLFYKLMSSEYGLSMRIYGDGEIITESMGIDRNGILSFGLGLENMFCALGGALIAQISGDFSANMGSGCLIFGISAIIIGKKIVGGYGIKTAIIGSFAGAVCYQIMLKLIVSKEMFGLGSEYNNIILAIVLMLLVSLNRSDYDDTRGNE